MNYNINFYTVDPETNSIIESVYHDPRSSVRYFFHIHDLITPTAVTDGSITRIIMRVEEHMQLLLCKIPDLSYTRDGESYVLAVSDHSDSITESIRDAYQKFLDILLKHVPYTLNDEITDSNMLKILNERYQKTHESYSIIQIGETYECMSLAIQATNKMTRELDIIATMRVPILYRLERSVAVEKFMEAIMTN